MSDRTTPATHWASLAEIAGALDPATPVPVPAGWVLELVEAARAGLATHDLTVEAVAALLHRSPSTVRAWCAEGELPGAYRRGRSWYIPRAALVTTRPSSIQAGEALARAGNLSDWRRIRQAAVAQAGGEAR